jgi:uncharacterized protein
MSAVGRSSALFKHAKLMHECMTIRLVWDERKRALNIEKHGLDFATVTLAFFNEAIVRQAAGDRLQALGYLQGMVVSLVFRPLGSEGVSLISLRPASAKERSLL